MTDKDGWIRFCITNGIRLSVALAAWKFINFNTEVAEIGIKNGPVTKLAIGVTALTLGSLVPNDICDRLGQWIVETPEDYK